MFIYPKEWEKVNSDTERLKVPGGWIVKIFCSVDLAITFLPDSMHKWYLSEDDLHRPIGT